MSLQLSRIPGLSDLNDTLFAAGKPASGINLVKMNDNANLGLVRMEFFIGAYGDGDTVIRPQSKVDNYVYQREELTYIWGLRSTFNRSTHWITGPDSLWYAAWKVDQDTGLVSLVEAYRRSSNTHPNGAESKDGELVVFTVAQRFKTLFKVSSIGDFPDMTVTPNIGCSNITTTLKVKGSAFGEQSFKSAAFSVHSSNTSIPMTIDHAVMIVTPVGSTASVVDNIPLTFRGGSAGASMANGEILACDSIPYDFDSSHDFYFLVFCNGPSNSRCNGNFSVPGSINAGDLAVANPAGDITSSAAFIASTFTISSHWTMFESFKVSQSDDISEVSEFELLADSEFYQDRPYNEGLAQTMNRNAKYTIFGTEVMYMGEFVDGDVVPKPVSPYDGHVYAYADCKFMHSWRWTTLSPFTVPALSLGQLDRLNALVDGSGNVAIDVQYYPAHGNLPSHASGHGRVAVFALCSRNNVVSGTGS